MTDYEDAWCHATSIEVEAGPEAAFRWMSDGIRQGEWALGSLDRRTGEDGIFVGTSWFDGGETFVRIHADADRMMVHYEVGRSPDTLKPRTIARIVPGDAIGLEPGRCLVTLMVWRDAAMPDDRWRQQCLVHKTEMYRIRHLVEQHQKNAR